MELEVTKVASGKEVLDIVHISLSLLTPAWISLSVCAISMHVDLFSSVRFDCDVRYWICAPIGVPATSSSLGQERTLV